ncbi:SLC26A11 [Branchiostoma lanceolatum]|uniref:SLC26A11 protein n=1 Tax=Branchiostoma lanceolatum TaxID=7740 RepID=A0A8K0AGA4_BRALA|nr:SLC26A11 [Branchiostoma lanceolatum]
MMRKCKNLAHRWADNTCSVRYLKKRLPIVDWLPKYNLEKFQGDLIAGLTVGLTVVPQGLAYAAVAELPLQHGLYSAFMGCFIYCVLGTSKDITLGPTALMSLMMAEYAEGQPAIAIALCLFTGLIQFVMGILRLGFLLNFMAVPVNSGFVTAAAIIIGCGQLKLILGLKDVRKPFIWNIYDTCRKIPETNHWDLILGLISFITLLILKFIKDRDWDKNRDPNVPLTRVQRVGRKAIWLVGTARNAIIVLVTTIFAGILYAYNIRPFTMTKEVPPGFPPVRPPSFSYQHGNHTVEGEEFFTHLGAGVAVIPMIGLLENIAIAKAFASKNRYTIDATQELFALGIANTVSCFFGSYPVTGSFSRTAVNSASGVMTPLGTIFTGTLVILAMLFVTPYFMYIPSAALGAVIIASVINMVEFEHITEQWRVHKPDVFVWVVTFFCVLFLGIEYGILAGVGVALALLLYNTAKPATKVEYTNSYPEIGIVRLDSGLYFPASDSIKATLHGAGLNEEPYKPVIMDLTHLSHLDFSVVRALGRSVEEYDLNKTTLYFACLREDLEEKINQAHIKNLRCFPTVQEAVDAIVAESAVDGDVNQPMLMTELPSDHVAISTDTEVLQNNGSGPRIVNKETSC